MEVQHAAGRVVEMPTIGRIVHYRLSAHDARLIAERRNMTGVRGNPVYEGNTFPAMIVGIVAGQMVQLQVFLDGQDMLWATSVHMGEGPCTWSWPPRG